MEKISVYMVELNIETYNCLKWKGKWLWCKVKQLLVTVYVYREFGSKNNQGSVTSLNQKTKMVRQYATESARCHVKILDRYLKLLPPGAHQKDIFCLQPLSGTYSCNTKRYRGRNTLGTMINVTKQVFLVGLLIIVWEHMELLHFFRQKFLKN